MSLNLDLRNEIEIFLASYTELIDDNNLELWPQFFAKKCLYKIVAKENFDAGLPLALLLCDSQGMLLDRRDAFSKLNVFAPRTWRHITNILHIKVQNKEILSRSNFAIFETLVGQDTHVLCTGEYRDKIVRENGAFKFRERICIYDTTIIPNSIVRPI